MSQEIKPQEEQNNLEKEDKQRKLLAVVLIILLLTGGALYYINSSKQTPSKTVQPKVEQVQATAPKKPKQAKKQPVKPEKQEKAVKTTISTSKFVKSTDRSSLLKLAMAKAGRVDPFSDSTPRMEAGVTVNGTPYRTIDIVPVNGGNLPAPPGLKLPFGGDLLKNFTNMMGKKLKHLPGMGLPKDLTKFFSQQPVDFEIKGFIGNKVIVNVDGMDEAVGKNETYEGIKVISVDPGSLKAVFEVKNQTITKKLKSLTDVSDREDIKLVNFK